MRQLPRLQAPQALRRGAILRFVAASGLCLASAACSGDDDAMPDVGSRGAPSGFEATPPPASAADPATEERNALIAEYQQIQQRLGAIQGEAFADSAMQRDYGILEDYIETRMTELDPEYPQKRERMQALQQEMSAAQQSGDQEEMLRIGQEGNTLNEELQALQTRVIEQDAVAADLEAFRERMEEKMAEIDPETPRLLERSEAIVEVLQSMDAPSGESPPGG